MAAVQSEGISDSLSGYPSNVGASEAAASFSLFKRSSPDSQNGLFGDVCENPSTIHPVDEVCPLWEDPAGSGESRFSQFGSATNGSTSPMSDVSSTGPDLSRSTITGSGLAARPGLFGGPSTGSFGEGALWKNLSGFEESRFAQFGSEADGSTSVTPDASSLRDTTTRSGLFGSAITGSGFGQSRCSFRGPLGGSFGVDTLWKNPAGSGDSPFTQFGSTADRSTLITSEYTLFGVSSSGCGLLGIAITGSEFGQSRSDPFGWTSSGLGFRSGTCGLFETTGSTTFGPSFGYLEDQYYEPKVQCEYSTPLKLSKAQISSLRSRLALKKDKMVQRELSQEQQKVIWPSLEEVEGLPLKQRGGDVLEREVLSMGQQVDLSLQQEGVEGQEEGALSPRKEEACLILSEEEKEACPSEQQEEETLAVVPSALQA